MAHPTPAGDPQQGRLRRLREELLEERVEVALDGDAGELLLREIAYAQRPWVHERHVPTYGALVCPTSPTPPTAGSQTVDVVPIDVDPSRARAFADGRAAFLLRTPGGPAQLALFAGSVEYEANLVAVAGTSGATVVQRTGRGDVKVITPARVVVWDGIRWLQKPHADSFVPLLRRLVPMAEGRILDGLLELCVHWLSPAFRGATFVWSLHRPAQELGDLDMAASLPGPRLQVARREHFAALLSAHGQVDGATLVDPDGRCSRYGATLLPSPEAVRTVPPDRGTRHTSARRFSYDHPGTLLCVVSEDGPVSVYLDGARVVLVASHPGPTSPAVAGPEGAVAQQLRCDSCGRTLIVDLPPDRRGGGDVTEVVCPVCEHPAGVTRAGAWTRGVATSQQARRDDAPVTR